MTGPDERTLSTVPPGRACGRNDPMMKRQVLVPFSRPVPLTSVIRSYYNLQVKGSGTYRGIRLEDLPVEAVGWPEVIVEYIRSRSERRPGDTDIEPEWATEAALDPTRIVGVGTDPKSGKESLSLTVIGYSAGAAEILAVWLRPKDLGQGEWYGQNAAKARRQWRRAYMEARTS